MRILMIPNDFPREESVYRSPFNFQAARELRKVVDLKILVFRAWLPGRKIIRETVFDGLTVIRAHGPVFPNSPRISLICYQNFIWPFVKRYFRNIDLIHTVGVDFAGLLGGVWSQKTGLPHITQFIADLKALKLDFKRFPYFDTLQNNLHGISCDGRALYQGARELFPTIENIRPIYRGVDLPRFDPAGPGGGPLAETPPPRFLFLGGLPEYPDRKFNRNTKGGVTLMKAWKKAEITLAESGAHLIFAGPGGDSKQAIDWKATLRFPERVFLLDQIERKDVPAFIRASDAVLMPSLDDGLPQLTLEASACGTPVIGSDLNCISEIVLHNKTGLIIPAGDVDAWANVLMNYAEPERFQELKALGKMARKRMESEFDSNQFAPQIVDLYNKAKASFH